MSARVKHITSLAIALILACTCCFVPASWADDTTSSTSTSSAQDAQTQNSAPEDEAAADDRPESVKQGTTSVDSDEENTVEPSQRADSTFVYDTTIEELSKTPASYDGQTVQVTGEVIGDKINDADNADYCWITVTVIDGKDSSSISVYMTREDADAQIDTYGRYNQVGTTLQVRGTFNQTCDQHDGTLDLHATSVTQTQKGKIIKEQVNPMDFFPGIMLIILAGVLTGIFLYIREKTR